MADPLRIESCYRTSRHQLSLLASPRNRLFHVVEFAEYLQQPDNIGFARAYAFELAEVLCGLIPTIHYMGTDPEQINRVSRTLRWLTEIQGIQEPTGSLKSTHSHLQTERQILFQQAMLRPGWVPVQSFGVILPVVEHECLLPSFRPRFASLSFLRINLHGKPSGGEDEIHVDHLTPAEVHTGYLYDALKAARAVLMRWKRIDAGKPVAVFCSTSGESALRGGSFGTGLGVGLISLMLKARLQREEFAPRKDAAFTGVLGNDGRIGPVTEDGLKLKIEACYYSPLRYLCVPEEQRELALAHILKLKGEAGLPQLHPPLEIVPAGTLDQVMFDRRLVESRQVPAFVHAARSLWQHRRALATVIMMILLATIARLAYGPMDKNPTGATYSGSIMTVRNAAGQELERMEIGAENVRTALSSRAPTVEFLDLDGDGRNEVFWTQNGVGKAEGTGTIHCRSIGERNDRWTVTARKEIRCPENPVSGANFRVFSVAAGTGDTPGSPGLLVLARHPSFPSLLLRLDALTGQELSCYVHPGHITEFILEDYDNDGNKEILLTGVNNAYGEAFFAILNQGDVSGHGPVRGRYAIDGMKPAHERAYMLLPKSIVHEAFPDHVRWNIGSQVDLASSGTRIQVSVSEYADHPQLGYHRVTYHILLSSRLTPVAVETGDDFDLLAERYFLGGLIRRIPNAQYWAEYSKSIRFWNGSTWSEAAPVPWP